MDSEDPRVEMLNTKGLRRCRDARTVARDCIVIVTAESTLPDMGTLEANLIPVSALSGLEGEEAGDLARMCDTKRLRRRSPAMISQPAKRYFPKEACSHSFGARRSAKRGV